MWILVVGGAALADRPDGAVATLRQLGCRVEVLDLFAPLDEASLVAAPPTAILVEALDEVDAARGALVRLRAAPALAEVPTLVAVTVAAIHRLEPGDGFDDFVLHPFVPAELYARLRRVEWRRSEFAGSERIKFGEVVIDVAAHEVTVAGRPVELTQQEFSLLRFLAEHRGRVFSRDQLLGRVWGVDYYGGSRTVDIHVRRLRMKLGAGPARALQTVRGVGYKLKAP
jgi:DNA-binding response OmpR family regulator